MSSEGGIGYELRDHVAWVTIERPERMNALDPAAQDALLRTWQRIEDDRDVRVVEYVLRFAHLRRCAHVSRGDLRRRGDVFRFDNLRRKHQLRTESNLSLHTVVHRV